MANSDVRAGDNYARHGHQWEGLQHWWRNLLGFPLPEQQPAYAGGQTTGRDSGRKNAKPHEAIFDFLNTWLVEQKPGDAVG